jgi:hypothetical protein
MIYYANGGFNWYDLYYMPIKLRDFYWRELLKIKEDEKEHIDKVNNSSKASNSSKTKRK